MLQKKLVRVPELCKTIISLWLCNFRARVKLPLLWRARKVLSVFVMA